MANNDCEHLGLLVNGINQCKFTKGICNFATKEGAEFGCKDYFKEEIPVYISANDKPENPDMVNSPPHYTAGGIECIDALEAIASFHKDPIAVCLTWQCVKYLWRWPLKNGLEDLKKTQYYLNRLIEHEEKKGENNAK